MSQINVQVHWSSNSEELLFFFFIFFYDGTSVSFPETLQWHLCVALIGSSLFWEETISALLPDICFGNSTRKASSLTCFKIFLRDIHPKNGREKNVNFSSSFPRSVDAFFKDNMGGINSVSWTVTLLWFFDGHINPIWFNQAILPTYLQVEAEKWSLKQCLSRRDHMEQMGSIFDLNWRKSVTFSDLVSMG